MLKKLFGAALTIALMLGSTSAAHAATPTASFKTIFEGFSLNAPAAGSLVHIKGTDLDQVTGAKFVGISPVFAAITAPISEQNATSLSVAAPTVAFATEGTSKLFLVTAAGDIEVGYFQHVGATKVVSSISFRNTPVVPASVRANDPATDLTGLVLVNVTNKAVGMYPVTYTTSDPLVCAVVDNKLTYLAPGSCVLTAQLLETNGVAASNAITKTVTVGAPAKPQTITASAPNTMVTFKSNSFALNASATSGLPVSFASSTPAVCFVVINTVYATPLGGTCTVTVTQPGDATWAAAVPYVYNITITDKGVAGAKTDPTFPLIASALKVKGISIVVLNGLKGTKTAGSNVEGLPTTVAAAKISAKICSVAPIKDEKTKKIILAYLIKGLASGSCSIKVTITGNKMYYSANKTFVLAVTK